MDETSEPKPAAAELIIDFNMRSLDAETLALLVEDKIATGG